MPNAPWGPINREGRNEFQLLIAAASIVTGWWQLGTNKTPNALRELSHGYQLLWAVLLIAGGLLIIVAALSKRTDGIVPHLEIGGLVTLGGVFAAYGVGVYIISDTPNIAFSMVLFLVIAAACLSRAARIIHAIWPEPYEKRVREEVRRRAVESALRQADEIVGTKGHDKLSPDTDPEIPVVFPVEKDDGEYGK